MRRIAVAEYQRIPVLNLSPATATAMAATGAVRVHGPYGATTLIEARSTVGVARVGTGTDAVELNIRPKVGVPRLLWLLGHARDQSGWRADDVTIDTDLGLVPAMAIMFEARCRRALAAGVLHGYREHDDTLPALRGRLREADQMRARPGMALPLDVRYDDYTSDIDENRILRTAARLLLTLTGTPPAVRLKLTRLDRHLADAIPLIPGQPVPRVPTTRLNRRYAPALHLAGLVLARTSIEACTGATTANGFLFDMNRVYEDWLTQALTEHLTAKGGHTRRQHATPLDQSRQTIMRADLTWWNTVGCRAVIDAKYTRLPSSGPPPEHLYQALAYCQAFNTRNGHLVYAAGSPTPPTAIRHSHVTIHTHVVPITQDPHDVLAAVAGVANRIAAAV